MRQVAHEVEYFQPAREGDTVEIVSWLCGLAGLEGAWTYEIYHVQTGQLLARDYALCAFLDSGLQSASLPELVLERLLKGPQRVST